MKALRILFFLSLSLICPLSAQGTNQPADDEDRNDRVEDALDPSHRRFWQASLPGGHYMVALDRISNISMHEYVLDGTWLSTRSPSTPPVVPLPAFTTSNPLLIR